MTPTRLTQLIDGADGRPKWFVAHRADLRPALRAIPDKVLLDAYARAWSGKPPRRLTATGLRRKIVWHLELMPAGSPSPARVTLLEASRLLGENARTLRRRIDRGELPVLYVRGALAVEVPAVPPRWPLIPDRLRPDPRLKPTPGQTRASRPALRVVPSASP